MDAPYGLLVIVGFLATAWGIFLWLSPPIDDEMKNALVLIIGVGFLIAVGLKYPVVAAVEGLLLALSSLLLYLLYYKKRRVIEGRVEERYTHRESSEGPLEHLLLIEEYHSALGDYAGRVTVRVNHPKWEKVAVGDEIRVEIPKLRDRRYRPIAYRITPID